MPAPLSKPTRQALVAALIFAVIALLLQAWRSHVLLASYDQGIFQQVLWNSLRGHPFESTLSSQLSTNVIHSGEPAGLGLCAFRPAFHALSTPLGAFVRVDRRSRTSSCASGAHRRCRVSPAPARPSTRSTKDGELADVWVLRRECLNRSHPGKFH